MPISYKSKISAFCLIIIFLLFHTSDANALCAGTYRNYLDFLKRMKDENVSVVTFVEKVREDSLGSVWKVRLDEEIINPVKKKEIEVLIRNNDGCYKKINVSAGETWFLILERKDYSKYWVVAGNDPPLRGISKKNTDEFLYRERMAEMFAKARRSKGGEKIVMYYPDGMIWAEGSMKNGLLHGRWIMYTKEGKWSSTEEYDNGDLSGLWIEYDQAGNVNYKADWKNNKVQNSVAYDSEGYMTRQFTRASDGTEIFNEFDEQGQVITYNETYPKGSGKEHESFITYFTYYPSGILKQKVRIVNKKIITEIYSEDGKLVETKDGY